MIKNKIYCCCFTEFTNITYLMLQPYRFILNIFEFKVQSNELKVCAYISTANLIKISSLTHKLSLSTSSYYLLGTDLQSYILSLCECELIYS